MVVMPELRGFSPYRESIILIHSFNQSSKMKKRRVVCVLTGNHSTIEIGFQENTPDRRYVF